MMTDSRLPDMVALYQQGKSLKEIGDIYGLTRQRISQIFYECNVLTKDPTRRRTIPPQKLAHLKQAYRQTGSILKAAKEVGISRATAFKWLHKAKVKMNPVGRPVPAARFEKMKARYRQCHNFSQVAREFNVSPTAVRMLFNRRNVPYHKNKRRAQA